MRQSRNGGVYKEESASQRVGKLGVGGVGGLLVSVRRVRRLWPRRGKGCEATEARWPQLDYQDRKLGLSTELEPWGATPVF